MTSFISTYQVARCAVWGFVGAGAIMAGADNAQRIGLFKENGIPTTTKVGVVASTAFFGAISSPLYVPLTGYLFYKDKFG